ncbi:hypothetical protein J0910_30780 [Nocardiopsis sp. CNT-189]|uniref:hypothetical protein n=1 Tax=Nocardiopsis oceanisediminis TaxID=2816862 RepID=UPI003B2937CF
MELTFLGKETAEGDSPTLYATDRGSYIVQGWKLTPGRAPWTSAPDGRLDVEIYTRLLNHLSKDGVPGRLGPLKPPVVGTTGPDTCIVRGSVVTDRTARARMAIPDHEDCVEVPAAHLKALFRE